MAIKRSPRETDSARAAQVGGNAGKEVHSCAGSTEKRADEKTLAGIKANR